MEKNMDLAFNNYLQVIDMKDSFKIMSSTARAGTFGRVEPNIKDLL
jgi:hypothetical protein